jgi:hypothetical protein
LWRDLRFACPLTASYLAVIKNLEFSAEMKSPKGKSAPKPKGAHAVKKKKTQEKTPEWIAAAERAFRRVARKVRAENKRWGLPLLVWKDGKKAKIKP